MAQKLRSFVLRLPTDPGTTEAPPGALPSGTASSPLRVEQMDLEEGERAEIASESDAIATGISMPFSLIEPKEATAAPATTGDSWGIASVGADALDETAGAGVKVAVLDTGIADHEAFDGLNPITRNFTQDVDEDVNGHGTHCAGTIFGQDVGGRRIGIARGVRNPLIGKVLGPGGGGSADIMEAIFWAQREGAKVISMSLGIDFPGFQKRLMQSGLEDVEATSIALQAYRENVRLFDQVSRLFADNTVINAPLLVAAAGNESNRPDFTIATAPPAVADDILSVGALSENRGIAWFSNTSPDCSAPGVDILSADHTGGLKLLSGTSMATPHVAGLAAVRAAELMAQGNFTARELREAVLARTETVAGLGKADAGIGQTIV